jgi:mannan endo-1,4-beta-mannosidase
MLPETIPGYTDGNWAAERRSQWSSGFCGWWTGTLSAVLQRHRLAYIMAWRNAGDQPGGHREFYVPFTGQASAPDFIRFHASPRALFQQAATKEKLYQ